MSLPKVIKAPAVVLSTPTKPVEDIDRKVLKLASTMALVVRSAKALGLAANQIGYSKSMFVYVDKGKVHTVINPRITDFSEKIILDDEGCLSIPKKVFKISRPEWVTIEHLDTNGDLVVTHEEGLLARCILHEIDHLEGRLINGV